MELENPNALTLTLSPERSITEGHVAVTDLGQGFDIELKLMNTVCTYIARAKSIIIEPYTNSVITLEIEEIKPHIILPAKKTGSAPSITCTFFAVANPEKKDGLVFKGSIDASGIHEFAFDKYGRLFFLHATSGFSNPVLSTYDNSVTLNSTHFKKNLFIDTEDNTVYYGSDSLYKRALFWDSWGTEETSVRIGPNDKRKISVGKHYIVTSDTIYTTEYYYYLRCIDKFDMTNVVKKIKISKQGAYFYPYVLDIIVDGDILYVIIKNYSTSLKWSKLYVYSLPDFKLLKTVTGFYSAIQFLGKRDGKIYIADKHSNTAIPKRLGIYDTLTGKLKFIDVKEFSNEIEFAW
ncbi:MAG: hypothetical protein CR988_00485 [Treponema sp.]|nr:MAG: hypothetical protein CR988_00485 [Treponema sp.]